MIRFSCPRCKRIYNCPEKSAGRKFECVCGQRVQVPEPPLPPSTTTVLGKLEPGKTRTDAPSLPPAIPVGQPVKPLHLDNDTITAWVILGVAAGCALGFFMAQHSPLWGGIAMWAGRPYSPARFTLVPGHALLIGAVGGAIGFAIGRAKKNEPPPVSVGFAVFLLIMVAGFMAVATWISSRVGPLDGIDFDFGSHGPI